MIIPFLLPVLLLVVATLPGRAEPPPRNADFGTPPLSLPSPYSQTTLVLFNRRAADSESLARYYAAARAIPLQNLIGLDCPEDEEISRDVYRTTIESPLRRRLLEEGWWLPERDASDGSQLLRSRFHFFVLIHGMPLRIADDSGRAPDAEPLESTAASVDSELTVLGRPGSPLPGPLENPYHRATAPFHAARVPLHPTGRIDAPSLNRCRTMIDDALLAESRGLWGQAYIDLDDRHPVGNDRLRQAATAWRKLGIPVTVDDRPDPLPVNYPMRDTILYFGWHADQVNGPFLNPAFKFQPGAIACHLHSLNAATLRSTSRHWAGPLLARGASAVLGTVDEPYVQLSHDLGIFAERLASGLTFIESAYAACEGLSWMNVAVGDPLYRPFPPRSEPLDESRFGKDQWLPYKILRLAYERWGGDSPLPVPELYYKLELALAKSNSPELMEHLALVLAEEGNLDDARIQFLRAKAAYADPRDKLRQELHLGCLDWKRGDRLDALKVFRSAAEEFTDLSEARAAREWMDRVSKSTSP